MHADEIYAFELNHKPGNLKNVGQIWGITHDSF